MSVRSKKYKAAQKAKNHGTTLKAGSSDKVPLDKPYDDATKRMFDLAYYPMEEDPSAELKRLLPRLNGEKEPDDE